MSLNNSFTSTSHTAGQRREKAGRQKSCNLIKAIADSKENICGATMSTLSAEQLNLPCYLFLPANYLTEPRKPPQDEHLTNFEMIKVRLKNPVQNISETSVRRYHILASCLLTTLSDTSLLIMHLSWCPPHHLHYLLFLPPILPKCILSFSFAPVSVALVFSFLSCFCLLFFPSPGFSFTFPYFVFSALVPHGLSQ